jgi:hypothetical protein
MILISDRKGSDIIHSLVDWNFKRKLSIGLGVLQFGLGGQKGKSRHFRKVRPAMNLEKLCGKSLSCNSLLTEVTEKLCSN